MTEKDSLWPTMVIYLVSNLGLASKKNTESSSVVCNLCSDQESKSLSCTSTFEEVKSPWQTVTPSEWRNLRPCVACM